MICPLLKLIIHRLCTPIWWQKGCVIFLTMALKRVVNPTVMGMVDDFPQTLVPVCSEQQIHIGNYPDQMILVVSVDVVCDYSTHLFLNLPLPFHVTRSDSAMVVCDKPSIPIETPINPNVQNNSHVANCSKKISPTPPSPPLTLLFHLRLSLLCSLVFWNDHYLLDCPSISTLNLGYIINIDISSRIISGFAGLSS